MTTAAYTSSGSITVTQPDGRAQSFAADSPEAVALLATGVVPSPYVAPVPQVVSCFQAKAALLGAGLLSSVEAFMAQPGTPAVAKLAWSEAIEFRRDSPTILALSAQLGWTNQQLDDLFVTAAGISA